MKQRTLKLLLFASLPAWMGSEILAQSVKPIDRHGLVSRHNVLLRAFDSRNPLSLGNGEFAFTVDVTGLQTFAEAFTNTTPLGTLSQWGWHASSNAAGWSLEKYAWHEFDVFGRKVPYVDVRGDPPTPEARWLSDNPHRLHLGQLGFWLAHADGTRAQTQELTQVEQTLDLWNGLLLSRFVFDGQVVEVQTVCHPARDLIAVRVSSPLLRDGRLKLELRFPYGTGSTPTADWTQPQAHQTLMNQGNNLEARFARRLDQELYYVAARWSDGGVLREVQPHHFVLSGANPRKAPVGRTKPVLVRELPPFPYGTMEFVCEFLPNPLVQKLPSFSETKKEARDGWNTFWENGGAIELAGSADPRWFELERRLVLSQYLTAIQCAGSLPPSETGLTYNSPPGKFHLALHWWEAAHFALWNRLPLLQRSLAYYDATLGTAQALAHRQGYTGARWPELSDRVGAVSPSSVAPFLIWQQPHPIFFAELCYRATPDRGTLSNFRDVVMQSAEFMSSYAEWDANQRRFVLGPVLQGAQEILPRENSFNPPFELTYWRWGLETAQQWRLRLGLTREPEWDRVLTNLARPPAAAGRYLFAETATNSYSDLAWAQNHPSVTGAFGLLPGPGIDRETMRQTLDWIWSNWNWSKTWGWDYPMLAMCAARLGQPERALDALLRDTPKNHYTLNGHLEPDGGQPICLPANGGLLYAAAMMAAGWDGAPSQPAPGFPRNAQWHVRWENLRPAP